MEWEEVLKEYERSRSAVSKGIRNCGPGEDRTRMRLMYQEMSEDIRLVKEHSLRELQSFIQCHGAEILTPRQIQIMSLRASGKSLGRIASELGVSKTAIQKSVRLSEKKIVKYFDTEEGSEMHENLS